MKKKNQIYKIIIFLFALIIILVIGTSYAISPEFKIQSAKTEIIRLDEDAYGNTSIDTTNLKLIPILDKNVQKENDKVIHINFNVGGAKENTASNIVYDIALSELQVSCNLLSPYVKWKLIKNGYQVSEGSLDYKFDTISKGRLVLTNTTYPLKPYSTDKATYDKYDFYLWISDSCQEENIEICQKKEDQSNLLGKLLTGKIEVEVYTGEREPLRRNPSSTLNTEECLIEESD